MICMFIAIHYCWLMADVYENFRNMYLKIYQFDPARSTAPGLARQAALKRTKIGSFTDMDMLLMVDKRFGGGICHFIYQNAKANNKYMKDCDKNKKL